MVSIIEQSGCGSWTGKRQTQQGITGDASRVQQDKKNVGINEAKAEQAVAATRVSNDQNNQHEAPLLTQETEDDSEV